jgi:hypothetical protein
MTDQIQRQELSDIGIDSQENMDNAISVAADAISRTYSIIFMSRQLFIGKENDEETPVMFGHMVRQSMQALARKFPDFEDFQFTVIAENDDIKIVGENNFTNAVLGAITQTLIAPIAEVDPNAEPAPSLINYDLDHHDDEGYHDFDLEDEEEEEFELDDEDEHEDIDPIAEK